MSEYMRNKGIIKKLSTPETTQVVFERLLEDGKIKETYTEYDDKGVPTYIEDENYDIINGCIFDVSGAPAEYDSAEDIEEVEKLNDTDYRIHLYYYNGGTCDKEILEDRIPEADKKYSSNNEWRESANVLIRVHLHHYDDESKTYVYEGLLDELLSGDDGGQSGFDSIQASAAQNPDGSGGDWESWCIDKVEYKDVG